MTTLTLPPPDDIRRLPAGRETDRLVREAVYGSWDRDIPYSTTPARAVYLIEELRGRGVYLDISPGRDSYDAAAFELRWNGGWSRSYIADSSVTAPTLPLAVCRCVLLLAAAGKLPQPK